MEDTPRIPRPASTVILLREAGRGIEVYLLKRSSNSGFMPGHFVFPGGMVEEMDLAPAQWGAHIDLSREEIARRLGGSLDPDEAMGYGIAAIRETFEEAGILFARHAEGQERGYQGIAQVRTTKGLSEGWLAEIVESQGWTLTLSRLFRWSHWITPKEKRQRFDTRFFIAILPRGQACTPDCVETTTGSWVTPKEALVGNLEGRMLLSPPTLVTLNELYQFPTMEALAEEAEKRTWGRPRQPRVVCSSHRTLILLPWDPMRYEEGEIAVNSLESRVVPIGAPFSRLWNHQGIWKPLDHP